MVTYSIGKYFLLVKYLQEFTNTIKKLTKYCNYKIIMLFAKMKSTYIYLLTLGTNISPKKRVASINRARPNTAAYTS